MSDIGLRPETVALHGGQSPDPTTKARAVPIYQTSSYVFDDTEHAADLFALKVPGNIYSRIMNPTWDVLEQRLTQLEGGIGAVVTASGQAAVTYSVLNIARAGDNIISVSQLYGGTYNLFAHTLPQYGIEVRFLDADDPEALSALVDENTRLVFGETIGNPRLNVLDVAAWADGAHRHGLPLISAACRSCNGCSTRRDRSPARRSSPPARACQRRTSRSRPRPGTRS
jgi:O-acetylhomoserine (thiol)-lyase